MALITRVTKKHIKIKLFELILNYSTEVKLKAYYALIYPKLIYGILSWGKSSHGNKVMMEKTM